MQVYCSITRLSALLLLVLKVQKTDKHERKSANEMAGVLRPRFCTVKAILGRGQHGRERAQEMREDKCQREKEAERERERKRNREREKERERDRERERERRKK